jgi:hypothetical protein
MVHTRKSLKGGEMKWELGPSSDFGILSFISGFEATSFVKSAKDSPNDRFLTDSPK